MHDIYNRGIESDIAFVTGTNCTSAFPRIIHLMETNSSEVVVIGFFQKISTSFPRVIVYSQIASADVVVSIHVALHMS